METKTNHIFLDLKGTPIKKEYCQLPTGYGYYAYICSDDPFIITFFKDMCLWSGKTKTYETRTGDTYDAYELDCRDKEFFKSDSFSRICKRHNVEVTIFDDGDNNQIIIDFWDQMKHM